MQQAGGNTRRCKSTILLPISNIGTINIAPLLTKSVAMLKRNLLDCRTHLDDELYDRLSPAMRDELNLILA